MSKTESKATETAANASTTNANPAAAFPGADLWASFVRDQIGRAQTWSEELARLEATVYDRMRTVAGDASRAMTDSIGHLANLSSEWRKLALDASRRAAEMSGARG